MEKIICRELAKAVSFQNKHLTIAMCSLVCALIFVGCVNTTPPANVSNFTATAGDKQVVLAWTLPSDPNFSGVKIQRNTGAAPTSPTDGTTAYDGAGATFTDTNLTDGTPYYYAAFSYNANHNYSAGVRASATPTIATAQANVLSEIATLETSVASYPSSVFDDATQAALQGDLAQIDGLYRAGDVCGAADATQTYLAALQGLYQSASKAAAEILYNSGRSLRYDMLTTPSAKGLCPDADRVGVEATATVDPQTSNLTQVNAAFSFGEPQVATAVGNGEVFTNVTLPGVSTSSTDVGSPALPVVSRLVAIPDGATVQATVTPEEAETIQMNPYPTQEPGLAQAHPAPGAIFGPSAFTTPDPSVYGATAPPYPADLATVTDLGMVRGIHTVRVDVPAVQFDPKTSTLHLFKSSNISLTFTGGTGFGTYSPGNVFEPMQNIQSGLLLNSSLINSLLGPQPFIGNTEGAELLIVTNANFLDAANALAQFKTNSGIVTNVIQVGQSGVTSTPSSSSIRNTIVNYYNKSQIKFSYLLLIGDVSYIAPYYFAAKGEPSPPSDFGYSTPNDPTTAIWSWWATGRLPVSNDTDANAAVNKIINYEKNPSLSADFYKHVTLCTDFECCQAPLTGFTFPFGITIPFNPPLNQGIEQQPFLKPLETVKSVLESQGFNVQRLYIESIDGGDPNANPPRPAYTYDPAPRAFSDGSALPAAIGSNAPGVPYATADTNDLINAWNQGRIFIFYNSHGWCNGPGWWGVPFGYWDADGGLTQNNPLPIVFSTTCDSGFYDAELEGANDLAMGGCNGAPTDPCFAEWMVRADKRGAVTIIASPRESLIYVNGHLNEGYANAIKTYGTGTIMHLADVFWYGQGWVSGSCAAADAMSHNRLYHIFGDPSLRVRMQKPSIILEPVNLGVLLQAAGKVKVTFPTEGAIVTALQNVPDNPLPVPVGRGIIKNGETMLQMLTTPNSNTIGGGSNLQFVVAHPDALPIVVPIKLPLPQFTLTYASGANGTIAGISAQTVDSGTNGTAVTAVPAANYHFVSWSDQSTQNPRTDANVTADLSVTASFAINSYRLGYLAGANGTISGTAQQTVDYGGSGTAVTAVPNPGYLFVSWDDNSTQNPRTDTNVTTDIRALASFAANAFTLTYTPGANGTISGTSPQSVDTGGNGTAVTAVANTGYHFVSWSDQSTQNPRTDANVTVDITVTANFAANATVTLTLTPATNGTVAPDHSDGKYLTGQTAILTATPAATYQTVWPTNVTVDATNPNAAAILMDTDKAVTVTFAPITFQLTLTATTNGTVTADKADGKYVTGQTAVLTAVPAATYRTVWPANVTVDTTDPNKATILMDADKTVTVTFTQITFQLTLTATTNGTVTADHADGMYVTGQTAVLTATPSSRYITTWPTNVTVNPNNRNQATILMDGDKTVTVTFHLG